MLSFLLGLLPGAFTLSGNIVELLKLKTNAKTDVEKAVIQEQINRLNAQRDVLVAAQGSDFTRKIYWSLLAVAASGPIAYITKIFAWDKVVGAFNGCVGRTQGCELFETDPLIDPNLWWVVIAVFTFLFLASRPKNG